MAHSLPRRGQHTSLSLNSLVICHPASCKNTVTCGSCSDRHISGKEEKLLRWHQRVGRDSEPLSLHYKLKSQKRLRELFALDFLKKDWP